MRDEIGHFLGLGVVEGIQATTKKAALAMQGLTAASNVNIQAGITSNGASVGQSTVNHNSYGAGQLVNVIKIGEKEISRIITPLISQAIANQNQSRNRAQGV